MRHNRTRAPAVYTEMECDIVCLLVAKFVAKYSINDKENEILYGMILSQSLAKMMIKRRVM